MGLAQVAVRVRVNSGESVSLVGQQEGAPDGRMRWKDGADDQCGRPQQWHPAPRPENAWQMGELGRASGSRTRKAHNDKNLDVAALGDDGTASTRCRC